MKRTIKIIQIPGYLLLAVVLFLSACSKKDTLSKELVAYVSPDFQPGNTYNNSSVLKLTPNGVFGDSTFVLPPLVRLTRPISSEVSVSLGIDTSLVSIYNKNNNTAYKLAPEGSYKIELAETMTIQAGETGSKDSTRIMLRQPAVFAGDVQYMIPLALKSASNGVSISSRVGVLYIIPKVTINQTNINDAVASPAGTLIDRKAPQWKIAGNNSEIYGQAASILDGNFTTAWMAPRTGIPASAFITTDMGTSYALKAITVTPGYRFGSYYNSSTIQVLTSTDNVSWSNQGTYDGPAFSGSADSPDTRALNFFVPVTARYLKLVFTKGVGYAGVSELNAYQ